LLTLPTLNSSSRQNLELFTKAYNTKRYRSMRISDTMGISIKMVKQKELEKEYVQMATKIMESGILINNMAAERWNLQMVALNGGN
jgi:hypothetical protein